MTDEEKVKLLKEINDHLMSVYDKLRLSNTNYNQEIYQAFDHTKKAKQLLDMVTKECIDEIPSAFEVIVLQDAVIENEQTVEVKTNITGKHFDEQEVEIIFNGSIPSEGYIELFCKEEEWGMEVRAKNNVPVSVAEEYIGGPYCDPMCIKYFAPGTYMIEKGTVIGVAIPKQKDAKQLIK